MIIWAGILLHARIHLYVFERGTMTAERYRDEVLEPCVCFFRGAARPEFNLMDDNARPYRVLQINKFLESEDIRCMVWQRRYPDLNPIQSIWDALERATPPPSGNHPMPQNSVAGKVGHIATGTDKLPYFKYKITLLCLYICKEVIILSINPPFFSILQPLFHTLRIQRVLHTICV